MAVDRAMPVLVVDDYNTMIAAFPISTTPRMARRRSRACAKKKYGLVISDWNMEPMTGFELLKQVRAGPGLSKPPFIMVTAESKTDNLIAAKKAGVNDYVVKPFNAQPLQRKIEAVFPE